jgi:glycosyltransferase involved in cell wall biosynthesis
VFSVSGIRSHGRSDISVVVCTYNRRVLLQHALDSLIGQETMDRFSFEIIVVDDGSNDGTSSAVQLFISKCERVRVRYCNSGGVGIAGARNKGVSEATGEWVAFFDDDQLAEPRWLLELHGIATASGAECVAGNIRISLPAAFSEPLSSLQRGLLGETCRKAGREASPDTLLTGNVLIHRGVFASVGLFDLQMKYGGEDSEFFARVQRAGIVVWNAPEAVVYHIVPESRLHDREFRYAAIRWGAGSAVFRYRSDGAIKCAAELMKRMAAAACRDMWLLGAARLRGSQLERLDRGLRLRHALGYGRAALSLVAPRWFPQRRFLDRLEFRRGSERRRPSVDIVAGNYPQAEQGLE